MEEVLNINGKDQQHTNRTLICIVYARLGIISVLNKEVFFSIKINTVDFA